ncbi:MAG: antitoxin [Pseudomonadota bacterium]
MNTVLSPIESEFATAEEAAAYDRWFRAQVQESIDDSRPSIPHDQVMAEMRAIIASKRENTESNSSS